nr:hypothetical protein [uncultured Bradyrhizobium sp.]
MLHVRALGPARLGQQRAAHAFKIGSDRIEHFADAREAHVLGHLAMKPGIELVKAFEAAARDRGLLIGEILAERGDRLVRHAGGADAAGLDLQRTVHQHPLPDVFETPGSPFVLRLSYRTGSTSGGVGNFRRGST